MNFSRTFRNFCHFYIAKRAIFGWLFAHVGVIEIALD